MKRPRHSQDSRSHDESREGGEVQEFRRFGGGRRRRCPRWSLVRRTETEPDRGGCWSRIWSSNEHQGQECSGLGDGCEEDSRIQRDGERGEAPEKEGRQESKDVGRRGGGCVNLDRYDKPPHGHWVHLRPETTSSRSAPPSFGSTTQTGRTALPGPSFCGRTGEEHKLRVPAMPASAPHLAEAEPFTMARGFR